MGAAQNRSVLDTVAHQRPSIELVYFRHFEGAQTASDIGQALHFDMLCHVSQHRLLGVTVAGGDDDVDPLGAVLDEAERHPQVGAVHGALGVLGSA